MNHTLDFYLVFSPRKYHGLAVRVAMRSPALAKDEIPVAVRVSLPEALFKRPSLSAKITVPEGAAPPTIDADVQDNIVEILREQTGLNITLTVDAPPAPDGSA